MNKVKIATAATMSTLMSLFGCNEPKKVINLSDEFIEVKGIEAKDYKDANTLILVTISLPEKKDSTFTIEAIDSTGIGSPLVGKLDKGKTYSINGTISTIQNGHRLNGTPITKTYLEILDLKEETAEQRVLKLNNKIEQLEDLIEAKKISKELNH